MKNTIKIIALMALTSLAACHGNTTDGRQAEATEKLVAEADRVVGIPAITNWTQKKMMRDIYELLDKPNLTTYAYLHDLNGKLHCLGPVIGYGLPYSTQFTNPQRLIHNTGVDLIPQPEPNGVFVPEGLSATWLNLIDPETGKPQVVYVEPPITVSPIKLTSPVVATRC